MKWIDYEQLFNSGAGISRLYKDYLKNFDEVKQFYSSSFRETGEWGKVMEKVSKRDYQRSALVRNLTEQNKSHHCGIKTLANIDLLGNDNTLAVVTGQQIGLFTGPLYTIYKAITAIALAEQLAGKFPEYNFVPIFWVECEDHDFNEINALSLLTPSNDLKKVEYLIGGKPLEKNPGPVGSIPIDTSFSAFFSEFSNALQETEFRTDLISLLKSYYREGTTLSKAFIGLMNHFFEESGLIFINPLDPELKKIVKPIFKKELSSITTTSQLVIDKSAELEERYHAQIKAKSVNLFLLYKGGRYLIEPREHDFSLKGTRQYYSKEELDTIAEQTPELFSPNVVLRPICQDTLLPTFAYVGGPSEIAYFAQLKPVYEYFEVPMPVIYPRASVTIVEERVTKILEKFQLSVTDLFSDVDPILMRIAEQASEVKTDVLFEALRGRIKEAIQEARFGIQQIDPTLAGSVDSTIERFESQLNILQEKTQKAQQKRQEISIRQIQKAALNIFPGSNFQEREFTVGYYMNKYGPDFVKWLRGEINIERFQHQVIEL
jgi:bacillithiol synthase